MPFDPNAAADPSLGIFGLPFSFDESRLVVIPVPFEATVSYGGGTEHGPAAVREASAQVDLLDRRFGEAWRAGICQTEADERFVSWGREARELASPIIERGGARDEDIGDVDRIDSLCAQASGLVGELTGRVLREGKIPCVLGGEHAVSLGAIGACAAAHGEIGVLQIDAHMDLRPAFEGFRYSHASVIHNALEEVEGLSRVVQVGIRDLSAVETAYAAGQGDRVRVFYDDDIFDRLASGAGFAAVCEEIVAALPDKVYVTFDIDGLDPSLGPNTGTPVPGGLGFREASLLLHTLARSGKRIVGCDLVEVAPGADGGDWDANVGARVLFRLCMAALQSGGSSG